LLANTIYRIAFTAITSAGQTLILYCRIRCAPLS
jgi:hypothetical protein